MPARILSGRVISDAIFAEISAEVRRVKEAHGVVPCLAVVRVGEDPASAVYVGKKEKAAAEVGIASIHHHLSADTSHDDLVSIISELNDRDDVDGILVQLPLPSQIDERSVLESISPAKDVDGFHPVNVGRLSLGYPSLVPCTPAGVIEILKRSDIRIAGKRAVIVGRSNIVGKPLAMLLLQENATVTVCHSRTEDLSFMTKQADILIAAIGRPGFIDQKHIREGATVIDVGINRVATEEQAKNLFADADLGKRLATIAKIGHTLVGDVNQKDAMDLAANFTPVPGGVGLLTVAMLMKNTLAAARARRDYK